jgi:DNA-binding transcriptional LysR family regulator
LGHDLTEAGAAIFDQALTLLTTHHKTARSLAGQDSRLEGVINLTMPNDLFEHVLAPHLAQFCADNPMIPLNLMLAKGLRDFETREADLALCITRSPPRSPDGAADRNFARSALCADRV